jgi:glucose-6-phosphate-specific signal transduction histidine kinase
MYFDIKNYLKNNRYHTIKYSLKHKPHLIKTKIIYIYIYFFLKKKNYIFSMWSYKKNPTTPLNQIP